MRSKYEIMDSIFQITFLCLQFWSKFLLENLNSLYLSQSKKHLLLEKPHQLDLNIKRL